MSRAYTKYVVPFDMIILGSCQTPLQTALHHHITILRHDKKGVVQGSKRTAHILIPTNPKTVRFLDLLEATSHRHRQQSWRPPVSSAWPLLVCAQDQLSSQRLDLPCHGLRSRIISHHGAIEVSHRHQQHSPPPLPRHLKYPLPNQYPHQ